MEIYFSADSVRVLAAVTALCTLLPLIFLGFFKYKNKEVKLSSFFIGVGFSLLFSFFGASLVNFVFISLGITPYIQESAHPIYGALYSALVSGTMPVIGCYIAMKYCMKNRPGKENALTLGIGLGGLECIVIGGTENLSTLLLALLVNKFGVEGYLQRIDIPADQMASQTEAIAKISQISSTDRLLDGYQCLLSLVVSISLTIFVYVAVQYENSAKFLLAAVLLSILSFLTRYLFLFRVMGYTFIPISLAYTLVLAFFAYRLYRKL